MNNNMQKHMSKMDMDYKKAFDKLAEILTNELVDVVTKYQRGYLSLQIKRGMADSKARRLSSNKPGN